MVKILGFTPKEESSILSISNRDIHNLWATLESNIDTTHGGLKGTPKFPPHAILQLCFTASNVRSSIRDWSHHTLQQILLGGIYDHIEGGFHRYSTDDHWHLPHFEKMLYDNALLITSFSMAYQDQPLECYHHVVRDSIHHMFKTWKSDTLYAASIDADSDGIEGAYYTIKFDELESLFSSSVLTELADAFQIDKNGNVIDEATQKPTPNNVFHRKSTTENSNWSKHREIIAEFRNKHRTHPTIDHRIQLAWNALLARSFIIAGNTFNEPDWIQEGSRLATECWSQIQEKIDHVFLEDIAYTGQAVLSLYEISNSKDELELLQRITQQIIDRFYDELNGGFWQSQPLHQTPISRIKDCTDGSTLSASAIATQLCLFLYHQTKTELYLNICKNTFTFVQNQLLSLHYSCSSFWSVLNTYHQHQKTNDIVNAINIQSQQVDSNTIEWQFKLSITESYSITTNLSLIDEHQNHLEIIYQRIHPTRLKRVDWQSDPLTIAQDQVTVFLRATIPEPTKSVMLLIEYCNDKQCFPAEKIPLIKQP